MRVSQFKDQKKRPSTLDDNQRRKLRSMQRDKPPRPRMGVVSEEETRSTAVTLARCNFLERPMEED